MAGLVSFIDLHSLFIAMLQMPLCGAVPCGMQQRPG